MKNAAIHAISSASLLVLSIFAMPGKTHAESCNSASSQSELNSCGSDAYRAADQKLNDAFKQIEHRFSADKDGSEQLRQAQRAWIGFRDAECKFASSGVAGGSAYTMVQQQCLRDLTEARVKQLEAYLQCEEGDLSCIVPRN